uniref:C-type lectin domain-containing protein n=1 Tax=Oreochromis aureus TaxID=47969 RepID=A0AAZ1Y1Z7_OREAU
LTSSTTGVSPFEASLGYQPPLFPGEVLKVSTLCPLFSSTCGDVGTHGEPLELPFFALRKETNSWRIATGPRPRHTPLDRRFGSRLGGLSTLPPHSREYHFVNQLMTWTEAQSYCRANFTDLVTIYNSDINQLLFSVSTRISTWAWIGLYNDRYSWKWSMEGKLLYVGSTHEFLNWANGQPDCVNAKEYCVALQGQTQMNDRPCGDSYPFLCYNGRKNDFLA